MKPLIMKMRFMFLVLLGVLAAVGCQTQQQMLQGNQGMAVQTAVNRARFDMNCSSATGQVLSTNVSQPSVQGPLGGTHTEYNAWSTQSVYAVAGSAEHISCFVRKAALAASRLRRFSNRLSCCVGLREPRIYFQIHGRPCHCPKVL